MAHSAASPDVCNTIRGNDSHSAASSNNCVASNTAVGPTRSLPCNSPLHNTSGNRWDDAEYSVDVPSSVMEVVGCAIRSCMINI